MMAKETPQSKKDNYITYCPKCNSTDIGIDNSNTLIGVAGLPADYICGNCGYTARVFPELEESEVKKLIIKKVEDKETEKVDVSYGRFIVNIFWKVVGPFAIVLSIFLFATYKNPTQQSLVIPIMFLILGIIITYFGYKKKNDTKE